jgi:hypothetical protein
MSEDGPASTIIDAQNIRTSVFTLNGVASNTRIDGFTIRRAQSPTTGGGIYMFGSSPTIANCVVVDNSMVAGGGISVVNSSPAIENCTIYNNAGLGGIYYDAASGGSVTGCIIMNTTSGSGLHCTMSADPQVSCTDIYGNDGGDAVCGTDAGSNFSADPRICDPAAAAEGGSASGSGVDIRYSVPMRGRVLITIHDVLGRSARVLVDGEVGSGGHAVTWDGTDVRGAGVASGVYFARMVYGNEVKTLRVVLVR